MRPRKSFVCAGALALAGASAFVQAQDTDWADVEGRIQYAYYTNDARALSGVLTALKPKAVDGGEPAAAADDPIRNYFRALAHYRMGQVLFATKKGQAKDELDECQDAVDASVESLPKVPIGLDETDENRRQRAESYTLSTACALAGREFASDAGSSRIAEAMRLEPKNPRVQLFEAIVAFGDAGKDANAKAAALTKLRTVTQAFERARAGASTIPEWGAAEAYALLGRALYEQRDVVGAREALERALLIAPEYAVARQLMARITK